MTLLLGMYNFVLGPEYVENIFLLFPHVARENWDKLSIYFSIFEW